mmetsp:Transcript_7369/g.30666  ORF Transcript_7369/g.30666 Transcript_7369/m.30666 type:complete len:231 (-) Transcript_7369:922-1614(-)
MWSTREARARNWIACIGDTTSRRPVTSDLLSPARWAVALLLMSLTRQRRTVTKRFLANILMSWVQVGLVANLANPALLRVPHQPHVRHLTLADALRVKVFCTQGTLEHVFEVLSPLFAAALSLQTPGRFGLLYLFTHSDFTWELGCAGGFSSRQCGARLASIGSGSRADFPANEKSSAGGWWEKKNLVLANCQHRIQVKLRQYRLPMRFHRKQSSSAALSCSSSPRQPPC